MTATPAPLKAHVFTDAPADVILKQFPGGKGELSGVRFSFGLDVPQSGIDVLIVFNRASYTIRTHLPRARTVFLAAEPDVIHPYKRQYLEQFGLVLSVSDKELKTEKLTTSTCWYWFAGIDFSKPWKLEHMRGHDFFSQLQPEKKQDRISIVTSTKVFTEYHRKRVRFIEELCQLVPEHIDLYGRGHQSIDDKADALIPSKYHVAIENGAGRDVWTEKLADPLLCWTLPFYAGCTNVPDYFPEQSIVSIDLDSPKAAARAMVDAIQSDLWSQVRPEIEEARNRILDRYNLACLLVDLAKRAAAHPIDQVHSKKTTLWSERSLWPEKGTRGSFVDWSLRNTLMLFDRDIELKSHGLRMKLEQRRARRRKAKLERAEKQKRQARE